MGVRAVVGLGILLLAVSSCGDGDGASLDEWVAAADEICADARDDLDDLAVETPRDVRDRGDEAIEVRDRALEDLIALDRPGGDDGEDVRRLLDALGTQLDVTSAALDVAVREPDDDLALLRATLEADEPLEESLETAGDVGSEDCLDELERQREELDAGIEFFEGLGPLGDIAVGDCVTGLAGPGRDADPDPVDCEAADAEGEVVRTVLEEGVECPERSEEVVDQFALCVSRFGPGPEEDGFLEIGSCVLVTDAGPDEVDVTEFACDDPSATHEISADVRRGAQCAPDDRRFAKTDEEIEVTGRGEWCATPL